MFTTKTQPDEMFTCLHPHAECLDCMTLAIAADLERLPKCSYHDTVQLALNAREELARTIAGHPTISKLSATSLRSVVRSLERQILQMEVL